MRGKSPQASALGRGLGAASMRPAHYAREVPAPPRHPAKKCPCFNEARALCAGSPCRCAPGGCPAARFNEARALCAGSPTGNPTTPTEAADASMRPAHYAREVPNRQIHYGRPDLASMRPAHYAREVGLGGRTVERAVSASMRPAHYAREVNTLTPARASAARLQ